MLIIMIALLSINLWAQNGYDFPPVSQLPQTDKLPDPWQFFKSDKRVTTYEDWKERRAEIKKMFEFYEYGRDFPRPKNTIGKIASMNTRYNGKANFYDVDLSMGPNHSIRGDLRYLVPTAGNGSYPVILYTNYYPNDTPLDMDWMEKIIDRGYIVAEWYCKQFDPYESGAKPGPGAVQSAFPDYDGAVLMEWSWGASGMITYLSSLAVVDTSRLILVGNSRRGKTALLTGAFDERIDLIVPSCSGCMGFPIFRFSGQDACDLTSKNVEAFPGWNNKTFKDFAYGNEARFPIDQHLLAALIAPRSILVNEGSNDNLANQEGSQESYLAVKEVYKWLGVGKNIGWYENENGSHGYHEYDWFHTIDFAEMVFEGKTPASGATYNKLVYPPRNTFDWKAPEKPSNNRSKI